MGEKRPLRRLRVQQFAEEIVLFLEEIFTNAVGWRFLLSSPGSGEFVLRAACS
jgi:hypothetical protein